MALNHQVLKPIPLNLPHSVQILKTLYQTTLKFQERIRTFRVGEGEPPWSKRNVPQFGKSLFKSISLRITIISIRTIGNIRNLIEKLEEKKTLCNTLPEDQTPIIN